MSRELTCSVALAIAGCIAYRYQQRESVDAGIDSSTPELQVVRGTNADMPREWLAPPTSLQILPISDPLRADFIERIAQREYSTYCDRIQKYLTRVFICEQIEFFSLYAAGTYTHNGVWLARGDSIRGDYSAFTITRTFHHEFAYRLVGIADVPFPLLDWCESLPDDFSYNGSAVDAAHAGKAGQDPDRNLWPSGFLTEYGKAEITKDIAIYWESIFTRQDELVEAMESSSRVREKSHVLLVWMQRMDPDVATRLPEKVWRAAKMDSVR